MMWKPSSSSSSKTTSTAVHRRRHHHHRHKRIILILFWVSCSIGVFVLLQLHPSSLLLQQQRQQDQDELSMSMVSTTTPRNNNDISMEMNDAGEVEQQQQQQQGEQPEKSSSNSSSSSSNIPPPPPPPPPIFTIVVHVGGELGNYLSSLAYAKGIQLRLLEQYNHHHNGTDGRVQQQRPYTTQLVIKQSTKKGKRFSKKRQSTKQTIKQCFPNIAASLVGVHQNNPATNNSKSSSSSALNLEHLLDIRRTQQEQWLSSKQLSILQQVNNNPNSRIKNHHHHPDGRQLEINETTTTPTPLQMIDESLNLFHQLIQNVLVVSSSFTTAATTKTMTETSATTTIPHTPSSSSSSSSSFISIPFLEIHTLDHYSMTNIYYKEIRDFLQVNTTNIPYCCQTYPYPNETVVHFRNFVAETGIEVAQRHGYEELDPTSMADNVVLGGRGRQQLQPAGMTGKINDTYTKTTAVVIVSRYNNAATQAYIQALNAWQPPPQPPSQKGGRIIPPTTTTTRLVIGQSGIQDFCFLQHNQKELIGSARSTYVTWAAILGIYTTTSTSRLYILDNENEEENDKDENNSDPDLTNRHNNNNHNQNRRATTKEEDLVTKFGYHWTHPELKRRVQFEVYPTSPPPSPQTRKTTTRKGG